MNGGNRERREPRTVSPLGLFTPFIVSLLILRNGPDPVGDEDGGFARGVALQEQRWRWLQ